MCLFLYSNKFFLATILFIIARYGFRDGKMVCWAACGTRKNKKKK